MPIRRRNGDSAEHRSLSAQRIQEAQDLFARTESVGQRRMTSPIRAFNAKPSAAGIDPRAPEISPNLWAGYMFARAGTGTALAGSHEQVADRIAEYHALGVRHFVLSGQPHIEEALWFADGAGDVLRRRGLWKPASRHPWSGPARRRQPLPQSRQVPKARAWMIVARAPLAGSLQALTQRQRPRTRLAQPAAAAQPGHDQGDEVPAWKITGVRCGPG